LIARKQIEAGAIGITCARLDEAETFLRAGIRDVLIANQVVGERKIARLMDVAGLGNLIICLDSRNNAQAISEAAESHGRAVDVLAELDTGLGRCGVRPGEPALEFVRYIHTLPGLTFRGLMGYEGGCFIEGAEEKARKAEFSYARLVDTANRIRSEGFPVDIVTAGGSNTYSLAGVREGITDLQVGSYVTMDTFNRHYGLDFEQALFVVATVISRPERGRAIIDAGLKAMSADHGLPAALGDGISVDRLYEEHARLHLTAAAEGLKVGDTITLVPSHGCTTIPLHDHYVLVRGGTVEGVAPIPA